MDIDISSLLRPEMVALEPELVLPAEPEEEFKVDSWRWACKEQAIQALVDIMVNSGSVRNANKLFKDMCNREKQATTAIGEGLAIPHVRTMQPRDLVMCFLRFKNGIDYLSMDDEPVYFMFGVVTPPYDDKSYFQLLTWLGRIFSECFWLKDALLAAENEAEIRSILLGLAREIV